METRESDTGLLAKLAIIARHWVSSSISIARVGALVLIPSGKGYKVFFQSA